MRSLAGTRVLVAGAGRGIGRAVAVACARESADVVLASRTRLDLEETHGLCGSGIMVAGDVSREKDVARIVEVAQREFNGIDVLVNAASVHGPIGRLDESDASAWRRALEVNLFGTFLLCRAVVPGMLSKRHGRIVLFAGGGATQARPGFSAYAASKAGTVRLAETLADELAPHVQVNAVAPGLVDTTLLDDILAAGPRAGREYEQVRAVRAGDVESIAADLVAELVVFLAGAAPPELTGRLISVPHDPWREWTAAGDVPPPNLYTLRRLDRHTVGPLLEALT